MQATQVLDAATQKVLTKLREKRRGVTFDDFARGFRLGARIFDLREAGFSIATVKEPLSSGRTRATYVLQ